MLTEDSLTKLYSTFLATFNEQSFRPCHLFIVTASFRKGLKKCHVTEDTPEKAWSAAVEALKKIRGEVVRVEFVNACRRVTWAECLEEMRSDSANHFPHGIAFDKDWQIVFTEQELNELLTPTNHASFDVTKFQKYCRFHLGCTFPNISETDEVEIFDTTKIFFQNGMSEPSTDIPPLRVGVFKDVNKLDKYTMLNLMTYMARRFNIELYFFKPKDINCKDETVNSFFIEGNTRIEKTIPLPKIVYDPVGYFYKKEVKEILKSLKNRPYFFQFGTVASKSKIFSILSADDRFNEFLIDTQDVESFDHFLTLLKQYHNDVVIKPISGSEGQGVTRVTFDREKYIVITGKEKLFFKTAEELKSFYEKNFTQEKHVLQPYIISRTKYGNPFDIRIHARRGAEGKFEFFPYPRFGRDPEGILSNISAGGYTMPIKKFLKAEFGNDWKTLYDKMMKLSKNFPDFLQSHLDSTIFSMGIDIGIVRHESSYDLKIFEVNTYNPGITCIPIEAALATLEYLQYLGKCSREGKLQNQ